MPPLRRRPRGAGGGAYSAAAKFSPAEIRKLEKLVDDNREDVFEERFHQKLADEFNAVRDRRSKELTAESLRGWFVRRIGEPAGSDTVTIRDLSGVAAPCFSLAEIRKLEILVADTRDDLFDERFHQKLADEFNAVRDRRSMELTAERLRGWFVRRIGEPKGSDTVTDSAPSRDVRDAGLPKSAPQSSSETTKVSVFNSISNHNSAPNWKLTTPPNPIATMPPLRCRRSGARATVRFSPAEFWKLKKLVDDTKDDLFDERLHQKLVDEFNVVRDRRSKELTTEDLREWFVRRKGEPKGSDTVANSAPPGDAGLPKSAAQSSSETTKGVKIPQVAEWEFEARSSNGAWYDVDTFVSHRNINDNLEACVRYQGFGTEDDEWVIVKDAVRLRSISLESSECLRVAVGDLVVCFRETSKVSAAHYDAYVLEIQRKLHDIRGCRCQFLIRYINDQTEEKVPLRRLCARPPPNVNFFQDAVSFFL